MRLPKRVTRAACTLLALLGIAVALITGAALMTGDVSTREQVFDARLGLGIGILAVFAGVWTLARIR